MSAEHKRRLGAIADRLAARGVLSREEARPVALVVLAAILAPDHVARRHASSDPLPPDPTPQPDLGAPRVRACFGPSRPMP